MTSRASVASVEYLRLPVTATRDGVEIDPTSEPVSVAIPASGVAPSVWVGAAWETNGPPYIIRVLIGPGTSFPLSAGRYDVYWKIDDAPEAPVVFADELVIFGAVLSRLISVGELADFLGADVDPESSKANLAVALATAAVQAATRQTIVAVADDVFVTQGNYTRSLKLPERPVTEVSAVTITPAGGTAIAVPASAYTVDSAGRLELATALTELGSLGWEADYWGGVESLVSVTYSHGFAVIPDELKAIALARAVRFYTNPAGVQAETILGYSVTYGRPAELGFLPDEADILSKFRRKTGALSTRAV